MNEPNDELIECDFGATRKQGNAHKFAKNATKDTSSDHNFQSIATLRNQFE